MQQKKRVMKRNLTVLTRLHASRGKRMQHPGMREHMSHIPRSHLVQDGHTLQDRLDQKADYRHVGRVVLRLAPHGLMEDRWNS